LSLTLKAAYPSEVEFKKIEFIVVNNIATKGTKEFEERKLLDGTEKLENESANYEKLKEINFPLDGMLFSNLGNIESEKRKLINSLIDKNVLVIENRWERIKKN